MKITSQFRPTNILIESEQDKIDLVNILRAAYRQETSCTGFLSSKPTVLQNKIQFLLDALKHV